MQKSQSVHLHIFVSICISMKWIRDDNAGFLANSKEVIHFKRECLNNMKFCLINFVFTLFNLKAPFGMSIGLEPNIVRDFQKSPALLKIKFVRAAAAHITFSPSLFVYTIFRAPSCQPGGML